MPRTSLETIGAIYEAANRGDRDGFIADMHADFEFRVPDRMMDAGRHRGSAALLDFFEDLLEPFEEVTVKPEKFFERGDRIVVFLLLRARPSASSAPMEIRIGHLWTMREGKAVQLEIFPEREQALEAVGMRDET